MIPKRTWKYCRVGWLTRANTKSEARSQFKRMLGLKRGERLPPGEIKDVTRQEA